MKTTILVSLAVLGSATSALALPQLYEQRMAQAEEARVITSPIAGIRNARWFDYRSDVGEAKMELTSDLRRATDMEDRRDAWEEYAQELRNERVEYVRYMAKRGHRYGTVIWDD